MNGTINVSGCNEKNHEITWNRHVWPALGNAARAVLPSGVELIFENNAEIINLASLKCDTHAYISHSKININSFMLPAPLH